MTDLSFSTIIRSTLYDTWVSGRLSPRQANGTWNVTGGTGAAVDDYALALAGASLVAQDSDPSDWLSIYSMCD